MDGTLLPPTKIMPTEIFPYIERLAAKGTVFVPASGRQLPNLKKLFEPVADKIAIIAENGGLVWHKGKIIFSDPTPSEGVQYALNIIRQHKGLYPLLSCADCAYYESDCEQFITMVNRSYSSAKKVDNLDEIAAREIVIKISIWDEQPCAEHGGVILPPLIKGLRTLISGYDWMDVSVSHANKGRALEALMNELGVEREESVAFGDHMNDYEMLLAAGKAYVTANAYPPLKEKVGEVILSNAQFGVIRKLEELL